MKNALDVAQLITAVIGVIAFVLTVRETGERKRADADRDQKDLERRERELADRVTAWAVTEGLDEDGEDHPGGVVVSNATSVAITQVDVRTQRRRRVGDKLTDDDYDGQRFVLIPPGTFYLRQVPAGADVEHREAHWQAPIPVVTGDFGYATTVTRDDEDVQVPLVPVAHSPEHKRVSLLRFDLAGGTWHRNAGGALETGPGPQDWDHEFTESQARTLDRGRRPKSKDVQRWIGELAAHLTGDPVGIGEAASVRAPWSSSVGSVEVSRGGQGLRLFAAGRSSDKTTSTWFAGAAQGGISDFVHEARANGTKCFFRTKAARAGIAALLTADRVDGAAVAEAVLDAMQRIDPTDPTITCSGCRAAQAESPAA